MDWNKLKDNSWFSTASEVADRHEAMKMEIREAFLSLIKANPEGREGILTFISDEIGEEMLSAVSKRIPKEEEFGEL